MSTFTMDMMFPGSRDKNINLLSHDWRGLMGSYVNPQEGTMPSLIHKNYASGISTSFPTARPSLATAARASIPTARPSLATTARPSLAIERPSLTTPWPIINKAREFPNQPFPWQKTADKIPNMFGVNNRIPNLPNGIFNQNPPKKDLIYQRRESNGFSERSLFPCKPPLPPNSMAAVNAPPTGLNNTQRHVATWSMNGINTSPSSFTSIKRPVGTWNSLKENDKDVWENRMKESAELLKLYKHGFADYNQNGFPVPGTSNPKGFLERVKIDQNRMKADKRYMNINGEKNIINYEPLSKNTSKVPILSHPPQNHSPPQMMNGYKSNAGILISSEKEIRKNSFSIDTLIDRKVIDCNGNFPNTNIRTPFENPNSRVKTWGAKSISSLSERVDSLKSGYTNSAFSPPDISKTQVKTPELHHMPIEYSNTSALIVGDSSKETKLKIVSATKENKIINEQRQLKNKGSIDGHSSEYTLPFKTQMKRSLAIYLGVDPEIDTVQYEPLNKNSKLQPLHARHVFSSQYSKGHDSNGRKEDRDTRVQSKKKSVYSCGYDVNAINLMLQNAKKRFKCYESS